VQIFKHLPRAFYFVSMTAVLTASSNLIAQDFVEYPNHPATYGDHEVPTEWTGGPSEVTLVLETDPTILHADGVGQSQRTARNTQNFVDDGAPQNFDNLNVVNLYGARLPLLQQMSSNGTSTLTYNFSTSINQSVDLFITDVDSGDDVTVRAFDSAGNSIDMSRWTLIDEGDLSLIKNTGSAISDIIAPIPTTVFSNSGIRLTAANNTNFNRSYSILRAPQNVDLGQIVVEFTGMATSTSRSQPLNGSHIYVALATAIPARLGDVDLDGTVTFLDIAPFIAILSEAEYQTEADIDQNGIINFLDIAPFIDILSRGV